MELSCCRTVFKNSWASWSQNKESEKSEWNAAKIRICCCRRRNDYLLVIIFKLWVTHCNRAQEHEEGPFLPCPVFCSEAGIDLCKQTGRSRKQIHVSPHHANRVMVACERVLYMKSRARGCKHHSWLCFLSSSTKGVRVRRLWRTEFM